MLLLIIAYLIYLVLYGLVSYAIIFHLIRFRVDGDRSRAVMLIYIVLSIVIIVGSLVFLRPVTGA